MLVERFQSELENNLTESKKDEDSIDVKYVKFVKHIKETAEDHFQPVQNSQRRRKEWMTDEILEVIEKKISDISHLAEPPWDTIREQRSAQVRRATQTRKKHGGSSSN